MIASTHTTSGQRRSDEGCERERVTANRTLGRARNGRSRSGSRIAEPDHRELRRGERDEDSERVEAGEKRGIAAGGDLGEDDQPDRERRRR